MTLPQCLQLLRSEVLVFKLNGFVQLPQKFHPPQNVTAYGTFAMKHRHKVQVFSSKLRASLTPGWKLTYNQGIKKNTTIVELTVFCGHLLALKNVILLSVMT